MKLGRAVAAAAAAAAAASCKAVILDLSYSGIDLPDRIKKLLEIRADIFRCLLGFRFAIGIVEDNER